MERSSANGASDICVCAWMCAYVCVCIPMCVCICTLTWRGGQHEGNNQWPSFLPSVQSNDCYLLSPSPLTFLIYSSFSPPFTGLTLSPTLSLYLAVFFFPTLLPLPSLFSLCYTVERWKSFLYPTHHSPVTINSIYVCLNRRVCEHGHRPRACPFTHIRTKHARISHPHTRAHIWSHPSSP